MNYAYSDHIVSQVRGRAVAIYHSLPLCLPIQLFSSRNKIQLAFFQLQSERKSNICFYYYVVKSSARICIYFESGAYCMQNVWQNSNFLSEHLFELFLFYFLFLLENILFNYFREGDKHQCVRETSSRMPPIGDLTLNPACALTGNRTVNFKFMGWHPTHWGTSVRAIFLFLSVVIT